MNNLKIYSALDVEPMIRKRRGALSFGESLEFINDLSELKNHPAKYVLFGIPEDVGVIANYGKKGTSTAWKACLEALVKTQDNSLTAPEKVIVLGEIDCDIEMRSAHMLDMEGDTFESTIGKLVEQIDLKVSQVVRAIISAGKVPVVIGGGHNNSLGILKGCYDALGKAINVINLDTHTDFKPLEHRHSGNSFSYAMEKGYIYKYGIFGIHKAYTSQQVYDRMAEFKNRIGFYFFEDVILKEDPPFYQACKNAKQFIGNRKFGLEIDADAISGFPSSAITPSGFSINQARQFARYFAMNPDPVYVHICEAIATENSYETVGKALALLTLDIMT